MRAFGRVSRKKGSGADALSVLIAAYRSSEVADPRASFFASLNAITGREFAAGPQLAGVVDPTGFMDSARSIAAIAIGFAKWADIRLQGDMQGRLRRTCVDILNDLENKTAFLKGFAAIVAGLGTHMENSAKEFAAQTTDEGRSRVAEAFFGGLWSGLELLYKAYHDFKGWLSTDIYQQFRAELASLSADDRLKIAKFYSRFEVARNVIERVLGTFLIMFSADEMDLGNIFGGLREMMAALIALQEESQGLFAVK